MKIRQLAEEKIESAMEAVRDAWGDLTSGSIFTTADLENISNWVLGGWISSIIAEEIQDRLEVDNPGYLLVIVKMKSEMFAERQAYCEAGLNQNQNPN